VLWVVVADDVVTGIEMDVDIVELVLEVDAVLVFGRDVVNVGDVGEDEENGEEGKDDDEVAVLLLEDWIDEVEVRDIEDKLEEALDVGPEDVLEEIAVLCDDEDDDDLVLMLLLLLILIVVDL
jgi:hypothetical protein